MNNDPYRLINQRGQLSASELARLAAEGRTSNPWGRGRRASAFFA
jgi:hypothetical protein